MVLIKRVSLENIREEGERLADRASVVKTAELLNTSQYDVIGPGGYLSPSTIGDWYLCPRRVYHQKFQRDVPRFRGLAMIFGQAFHSVMEETFRRYRDKANPVDAAEAMGIIDEYILVELQKPEPEFAERVNSTEEEFQKAIEKRHGDIVRTIEKFFAEGWVEKIAPTPEDVISVERDVMITVDGIPIYMVLDLELKDRTWDFKYTSASMIERRRGAIAADVQLWAQEMAMGKESGLLLVTPPPKSKKPPKVPRDVVTCINRHSVPLLADSEFVDRIEGVVRDINEYRFEARGKTFTGGCTSCPAHDMCTKETKCDDVVVSDGFIEVSKPVLTFDKEKLVEEGKNATINLTS